MATYRTIKELVIEAYSAKGSLPSYEELTELVKTNFPNSKWKASHYAWYKSKIKNGEIEAKSGKKRDPESKLTKAPALINLKRLRIQELFRLHEEISVELIDRNIIHSSNNIIANYSEKLACEALSLTQMPESTKGHDAVDKDGKRYEIKGRKPTTKNKSRQLSAIRSLDKNHFDFLVAILYEENFEVKRAAKIPHRIILENSTFNEHTNSWIFQIRDEVWKMPGVIDVTNHIKEAESKHSGLSNE